MQTTNTRLASQTLVELKALVDNLLLLLSDKEKVVIKKRFNLDNSRRHTLEEIGQEFSVTRERVRQIEKNALSKMKRNVFNTSLKHLHDLVYKIVRDHGGLYREDELHSKLKEIVSPDAKVNENNIHLALVLHEDIDCVGNTINFYPYLKEKAVPDYALKYASGHLINQLNKYGDVKNLGKIHVDLKDVFEKLNFDMIKMRSLVNIDKRLTLLDNDLVGLLEWRHIHPRTLRDKILYVFRNEKTYLHFTYIAEKITDSNFDNKKVNLQAVHNELIRHEQFILVGRGIYALKEWGYEKGTVADVIKNILKDKKELEQDKIIDLVLKKRQVKKITIVLALKNSRSFERTGRKRYKLKRK